MRPGFRATMLTFAALAVLALLTLEGRILAATLVFLGGFGVKTWIVDRQRRDEKD